MVVPSVCGNIYQKYKCNFSCMFLGTVFMLLFLLAAALVHCVSIKFLWESKYCMNLQKEYYVNVD